MKPLHRADRCRGRGEGGGEKGGGFKLDGHRGREGGEEGGIKADGHRGREGGEEGGIKADGHVGSGEGWGWGGWGGGVDVDLHRSSGEWGGGGRGCTSRNIYFILFFVAVHLEGRQKSTMQLMGRNGIITNRPSDKWAQQGFFFFFSSSGPVGLQSTSESHENRTLSAAILCLTGCVSNNKKCVSHVRTPLWYRSEAQSAVHETLQQYAT